MTEMPESIAAMDAAVARARRDEERRQWVAEHPGLSLPRPVDPTGPLLSVVVTVHNVGPWIDELLTSLRAQTLTDIEFLIIDDHSDDRSAAAVDAVAALDPRFTVIRPIDKGGAHARNVGADHARGRLLAFCDGDDIVPADAYATLVAAIGDHDIVFGDFTKFFADGSTWHPTGNPFLEARSGITLRDLPTLVNFRAVWNKVFSTEFWRAHDFVFPEVVRSNDIVAMVTAYLAATSMATVPQVTYLYRDRPGMTSMTSQIATTESLRSYLRQEQACAQLLDGHPASATFFELFASGNGWGHVSHYLLGLDDTPVDPEVVERVHQMWDHVDPSIRNELPPDRRAMFEALTGPTPQWAALVAIGLNPKLAVSRPREWLAAARSLVDEHRDLLDQVGTWSQLVDRCFVPGMRRLLLAEDTRPTEIADELCALLKAIDRASGGTPRTARNLDVRLHGALTALRTGDVDAFVTRWHRGRTCAMTVTAVEPNPTGLTLSGELVGDLAPVRLVARGKSGDQEVASVHVDPGDRTRWTATIESSGALAAGRKHRIDVVGLLGPDEEEFRLGHPPELTDTNTDMSTGTLVLIAHTDPHTLQLVWTPKPDKRRRLFSRR